MTIQILIFIGLFIMNYILIDNIDFINKTKKILQNNSYINKINNRLYKLYSKRIVKKYNSSYQYYLFLIVLILFGIVYVLSYSIFKIKSTAIILSILSLSAPNIIYKMIINNEKEKIIQEIPNYIINLKNNVCQGSDMLIAMSITESRGVLNKYIKEFNNNITKGINIKEAIDKIKQTVNLKEISILFNSIYICELNGGNITAVLEKYLNIIMEEIKSREISKEKSYSSILSLLIMICLNIYILFTFTLSNSEYSKIITETTIGKLILNFNILSHILIGYLISRIYKIEED